MRTLIIAAFLLTAGISAPSFASEQQNAYQMMEALTQRVKEASWLESETHKKRESEFVNVRNARKRLSDIAEREYATAESKRVSLESIFESNNKQIEAQRKRNDIRMGSLKELFGQVAGATVDVGDKLLASSISAELQDRRFEINRLKELVSTPGKVPSSDDIKLLWYEMQRELAEQSKISTFEQEVVGVDGRTNKQRVTRIGPFNLVSQGSYLLYDGERNVLITPKMQPEKLAFGYNWGQMASELEMAKSGVVVFGLDPTGAGKSSVITMQGETLSLVDRWKKGGGVGVVITVLGVIGLLVVIWRAASLLVLKHKISAQMKNMRTAGNNPLGRLMKVWHENKDLSADSLDAKLYEACTEESTKIDRGIGFIKTTAAVAPLLGLLGTVTGMIRTFQAISVHGTGDPKIMAGGISTALTTTVQGLTVAIPMMLLLLLVLSWAKWNKSVLEQQSAGLIARSEIANRKTAKKQ